MDASATERVRAGSSAWQIVDLGTETWEVVLLDARGADVDSRPGDGERGTEPGVGDSAVDRAESVDRRLASLERRAASVEGFEARVGELERAHGRTHERIGKLKRGQAEITRGLDARDAALREEITAIYRDAERALAESPPGSQRKPKWLQRRHELKLLRLERDRKIRQAERRLVERSADSLAAIGRHAIAAEGSMREAGAAAELGIRAAQGEASKAIRRQLEEIAAGERRLAELVDRIEAFERRLRSAEERLEAAHGVELAEPARL